MIWTPPQRGDTRTREFFAWLPIILSDGRSAWLERIKIVEVYAIGVSYFGPGLGWCVESCELMNGSQQ